MDFVFPEPGKPWEWEPTTSTPSPRSLMVPRGLASCKRGPAWLRWNGSAEACPQCQGVQGRSEPSELGMGLPLLFQSLDLGCQLGTSFPPRLDRRRLPRQVVPRVLTQCPRLRLPCQPLLQPQ